MAPEKNFLICTIPHDISNLEDLGILGMERGGLTALIPSTLGLPDILYFLELVLNQFTRSIPYDMLKKATLEQLDINVNRLSVSAEGIELLRGLLFI